MMELLLDCCQWDKKLHWKRKGDVDLSGERRQNRKFNDRMKWNELIETSQWDVSICIYDQILFEMIERNRRNWSRQSNLHRMNKRRLSSPQREKQIFRWEINEELLCFLWKSEWSPKKTVQLPRVFPNNQIIHQKIRRAQGNILFTDQISTSELTMFLLRFYIVFLSLGFSHSAIRFCLEESENRSCERRDVLPKSHMLTRLRNHRAPSSTIKVRGKKRRKE